MSLQNDFRNEMCFKQRNSNQLNQERLLRNKSNQEYRFLLPHILFCPFIKPNLSASNLSLILECFFNVSNRYFFPCNVRFHINESLYTSLRYFNKLNLKSVLHKLISFKPDTKANITISKDQKMIRQPHTFLRHLHCTTLTRNLFCCRYRRCIRAVAIPRDSFANYPWN